MCCIEPGRALTLGWARGLFALLRPPPAGQ